MPLQSRAEPWDHADWLWELKYDGFRSLAHISNGECRFVSRNGNTFTSFQSVADELGHALRGHSAILDGELVCLDGNGRPVFNDLLYRRREPVFVAFDALWLDGEDLRYLPLLERKAKLCALLHGCSGPALYADHVDANGIALYERVCQLDLEGVVAKHKKGAYISDRDASTWFKVRNRAYSQMKGRAEQFERARHREPVPGWHTCDLGVSATAAEQRPGIASEKMCHYRKSRIACCTLTLHQSCFWRNNFPHVASQVG